MRIGERLRFCRTSKGKTQAVVAGLAGVTEDYLSQIERGLKTPTIALLHRFAQVLGVRISELLGEQAAEHADTTMPAGQDLQRALIGCDGYAAPSDPVDLASLRGRVETAWGIWQGRPHRFAEESAVLPALTSEVQAAQRALQCNGSAQDRREGHRIAADLYFLLRTYAKRIGRADLALLAADRGVSAAEAADDPTRIAAARWNLAHALLAQGDAASAEVVALQAIDGLRHLGDKNAPDQIAMAGALWLVSAVAAMRNGDPWAARERLREHAWPAARTAGKGNVMRTVFGPANVALHAMSLEMEADDIDPTALPSLERRTTFALEVARCYEQRRDDPGVLIHLLDAEATGPTVTAQRCPAPPHRESAARPSPDHSHTTEGHLLWRMPRSAARALAPGA